MSEQTANKATKKDSMTPGELGLWVGEKLAGGAVSAIGGAILEQQLSDLGFTRKIDDVIEDVVWEAAQWLAGFIRAEFEESRLKEAKYSLNSLREKLTHYMLAPETSEDRLEHATNDASNVVAALSQMGLQGHASYMCAIGLQLAVIQERIKRYGDVEKRVLLDVIEHAIPQALNFHQEWLEWTRNRFRGPFYFHTELPRTFHGLGGGVTEFYYYTVDGDWKPFFNSHKEAKKAKEAHLDRELESTRIQYIFPSIEIVNKWQELRRSILAPHAISFDWSFSGTKAGYECIQILEPADTHTWSDNYLCVKNNYLEWKWSYSGPLDGWVCIPWSEPADPDTWTDNYLCFRGDAKHEFRFSSGGPLVGWDFVQIYEPREPESETWDDNFFCWRRMEPSLASRRRNVAVPYFSDFNGDGRSDLVWRRLDDTLEARINMLDGGTLLADIGLPTGDPGWKVVGIGDFNGDGKADLVWRRQDDTLEARLNILDGGALVADIGLPIGDPGWKVVGVGDFNGDGKSDLVWRRQDDTLEARIWLLDGGTLLAEIGLPIGDPGWKVVGVGDFNGDGKDDLVWRRLDDTGEARLNILDGGTLVADIGLPPIEPDWKIVGVGDFNGDGKADLVWRRQDDSGEARIWLLDGATLLADLRLPPAAPGWKIVGVGDFNGDGKDDLVWRRQNDTGEARIWLLDGGRLLADIGLPLGDPGWKVVPHP